MNEPYGKVILITGGSAGIGLAAAEIFARNGYEVWAASRRCEETSKVVGAGVIRSVRMDVCDDESVTRAVDLILKESGNIGTVLHCAGWGIAGACEDTPMDAVKAQMETNYYGVLRVNRAVLPAMRAQKRGLILAMSSVAAVFSIPFQSHYCSTKRALESYMETLRMELRPHGIRASILQPGDTKTAFTGARRFEMPAQSPYRERALKSVAVMERDEQNGRTPESVAKVAFSLAQRKNPPVKVTCGLDYKLLRMLGAVLPMRLIEWVLRLIYKC